jgi:hypothetical protein
MRHLAACLALFAFVQSSQAGTVSGTFQGIADIVDRPDLGIRRAQWRR